MKPSKLNTKGVKAKNSAKRKNQRTPQLGTISQASSNAHANPNSPQNHIFPMPTLVLQGTPIPPVPTVTRYNRSGSRRNPFGVKQRLQCKRYHKPSKRRKSSAYRGVTKCSEKRYESFVWDNDPKATGRGGRTVYIGGFKSEIEAAIAHDLIALKIWGYPTSTNFPITCYLNEIPEMQNMTKKECIFAIRRASQFASMLESFEINDSRNEEGAVPMSPKEQTVDGALPNVIMNEALPEHSQVVQNNYHGQFLEQHVNPSTLFVEQQNHDGYFNISVPGATIEMEAGNNINGVAFPNQGFTTEQPMFLEFSQESQAPQAFEQNQSQEIPDVNLFANPFSYDYYQVLAFQNGLSFQINPNYPYWQYDLGRTPAGDNTGNLGNALNLEDSSMYQIGNENEGGAGNDVDYSFGLDPIEFHSAMPNNQDFGAATPQVIVFEQRNDQPLQYDFNTNNGSQDETVVESEDENDMDISQYLNLNHSEEEEEQKKPHDWTDNVDGLWAKMKADKLISSDLCFKEDGTPL